MELVPLYLILLASNQVIATGTLGRKDVFSTNTLLQWLDKSTVLTSDFMDSNIVIGISTTHCKAIHLNMVVRDAAHFPSRRKMEEMRALHEKIVHAKDPAVFSELNEWRIPPLDAENEVVIQGINEMYELGNRMGKNFKELFGNFVNTQKEFIKFVSSSDQKAVESANYFYDGLSDDNNEMPVFKNEINDTVVKFSKSCFNHERLEQDSVNLYQYNEFLKTANFTDIMESLRRKLGLKIKLTEADVFLIYDWCAYAMYMSEDRTWCNLLSDDDRLVIEYGLDLLNYYKYSYGHPLNTKMSCPLIQDMFNTMDGAINRHWNYFDKKKMSTASYLAGKVQFGHVDTIIPLITALGLFKDKEPLLATNMAAMKDRKFKTSQISSTSSSVAFVLYACDNTRRLALNEFRPGQQTIRIQAFVNEVRVPCCRHSYYCSYTEVKQNVKYLIDNCNMTEICGEYVDITTQSTTLGSGMQRLITHLSTVLLLLFMHLLH